MASRKVKPGDYVSHDNETWTYEGPENSRHRLRSLDGRRVTIVRGELNPGDAPAVAADSQARVADLEKRVAELDAENKALKEELAELKARAASN